MLSGSKGAGYQAQEDPNAVEHLNQQYGNIQSIEGQLQGVANGTGPNPALAQLQQTTDQNNAQNAGFIASQKGIDPALAARLAAQNAGRQNQQAAGEAATMQANQQLGALSAYGNLAGNTQSGIQAGINSANTANSGVAQQNARGQFGLLNGLGAAGLTLGGYAGGGEVQKLAPGGMANPFAGGSSMGQFLGQSNANANSYISSIGSGQDVAQMSLKEKPKAKPDEPTEIRSDAATQAAVPFTSTDTSMPFGTSIAPTPLSPMMAGGGEANLKEGGPVPGKAEVKGDSYENDTVPAMLSPKEIVIPRHITMAGDKAPELAAEFVRKELAAHAQASKKNFATGGINSVPNAGDVDFLSPDEPSSASDQPVAAQSSGASGSWATPQAIAPAVKAPVVSDPYGTTAMYGQYKTGLNEKAKGIEEQAKAEGNEGDQKFTAIGQGLLQNQDLLRDYSNARDTLQKDIETSRQEYANGKIDPSRYVNNMSTGSKIATAIGLALSGLGAGGSGQQNLAAQYLNKQIENDVDAQKADLGKKENLLNFNYKKLGDLQNATQFTLANNREAVAAHIDQIAAQSQDPLAKARAEQLAGALRMESAPTIGEMARRQTLINANAKNGSRDPGSAGGSASIPAETQVQLLPEKEREKAAEAVADLDEAIKARDRSGTDFDAVASVKNKFDPRNWGDLLSGQKTNQLNVDTLKLAKAAVGRANPETIKQTQEQIKPNSFDDANDVKTRRAQIIDLGNDAVEKALTKVRGFGINPGNRAVKKIDESPLTK